jgi:hypothetical protein
MYQAIDIATSVIKGIARMMYTRRVVDLERPAKV